MEAPPLSTEDAPQDPDQLPEEEQEDGGEFEDAGALLAEKGRWCGTPYYSVARQRVRARIRSAQKCRDTELRARRLAAALDAAKLAAVPEPMMDESKDQLQLAQGAARYSSARTSTPPPPFTPLRGPRPVSPMRLRSREVIPPDIEAGCVAVLILRDDGFAELYDAFDLHASGQEEEGTTTSVPVVMRSRVFDPELLHPGSTFTAVHSSITGRGMADPTAIDLNPLFDMVEDCDPYSRVIAAIDPLRPGGQLLCSQLLARGRRGKLSGAVLAIPVAETPAPLCGPAYASLTALLCLGGEELGLGRSSFGRCIGLIDRETAYRKCSWPSSCVGRLAYRVAEASCRMAPDGGNLQQEPFKIDFNEGCWHEDLEKKLLERGVEMANFEDELNVFCSSGKKWSYKDLKENPMDEAPFPLKFVSLRAHEWLFDDGAPDDKNPDATGIGVRIADWLRGGVRSSKLWAGRLCDAGVAEAEIAKLPSWFKAADRLRRWGKRKEFPVPPPPPEVVEEEAAEEGEEEQQEAGEEGESPAEQPPDEEAVAEDVGEEAVDAAEPGLVEGEASPPVAEDEQAKAAMKIQAVHRGKMGRKKVAAIKADGGEAEAAAAKEAKNSEALVKQEEAEAAASPPPAAAGEEVSRVEEAAAEPQEQDPMLREPPTVAEEMLQLGLLKLATKFAVGYGDAAAAILSEMDFGDRDALAKSKTEGRSGEEAEPGGEVEQNDAPEFPVNVMPFRAQPSEAWKLPNGGVGAEVVLICDLTDPQVTSWPLKDWSVWADSCKKSSSPLVMVGILPPFEAPHFQWRYLLPAFQVLIERFGLVIWLQHGAQPVEVQRAVVAAVLDPAVPLGALAAHLSPLRKQHFAVPYFGASAAQLAADLGAGCCVGPGKFPAAPAADATIDQALLKKLHDAGQKDAEGVSKAHDLVKDLQTELCAHSGRQGPGSGGCNLGSSLRGPAKELGRQRRPSSAERLGQRLGASGAFEAHKAFKQQETARLAGLLGRSGEGPLDDEDAPDPFLELEEVEPVEEEKAPAPEGEEGEGDEGGGDPPPADGEENAEGEEGEEGGEGGGAAAAANNSSALPAAEEETPEEVGGAMLSFVLGASNTAALLQDTLAVRGAGLNYSAVADGGPSALFPGKAHHDGCLPPRPWGAAWALERQEVVVFAVHPMVLCSITDKVLKSGEDYPEEVPLVEEEEVPQQEEDGAAPGESGEDAAADPPEGAAEGEGEGDAADKEEEGGEGGDEEDLDEEGGDAEEVLAPVEAAGEDA